MPDIFAKNNTALASLLGEAGWSAADLARAVNALGHSRNLGLRYDRSSVAHWLTGTRPRPPIPDLVAQALSKKIGRLVLADDVGLTRPGGTSALAPPTPERIADPVHRLLELCRLDCDPAHRGLVRAAPYRPRPWTGEHWPAPDRFAARPARLPLLAMGRAIPAHADALAALAEVFTELGELHGGGRIRSALAIHLRDEAVPLLLASAPTALRARLLSATARLTLLLAELHIDMHCHGAAQQFHYVALELAVRARDRRAFAAAVAAMSAHAGALGHPRRAQHLAEEALDNTRHGGGVQHALALAGRALAHAQLGETREAVNDVRAAERALREAADRAEAHARDAAIMIRLSAAETYEALGRTRDAIAALEIALSHYGERRTRSVALAQARSALLMLKIGHLESACRRIGQFLDHAHRYASSQIQHHCAQIRRDLQPFRDFAPARAALLRLPADPATTAAAIAPGQAVARATAASAAPWSRRASGAPARNPV